MSMFHVHLHQPAIARPPMKPLAEQYFIVQIAAKFNSIKHEPHYHTTTILWHFFWDHPGQPAPEENFWTLWCKGRLTEADTLTIQLGATPSRLTSAYLHHPPIFFTDRMLFLPPNQQCQSSQGIKHEVNCKSRLQKLTTSGQSNLT